LMRRMKLMMYTVYTSIQETQLQNGFIRTGK
jgi:hypothetical protein